MTRTCLRVAIVAAVVLGGCGFGAEASPVGVASPVVASPVGVASPTVVPASPTVVASPVGVPASPEAESQPASRPRPELFEEPLTFDVPVSPSAPEEPSVIVAPAGFVRLPTPIPPNPGPHFVVTMKFVKVAGPHVHVVLVGRTTSPIFASQGRDLGAYVPMLVDGLRGSNPHFTLVATRRHPLCHRRNGYLIQYVDRSADPLAATVVFVTAGDTAWTATYEHDLAASDLAAGTASIDSLCPPLPAGGR